MRPGSCETNGRLSDQALRVLAVAVRSFDLEPGEYHASHIETDLTFLGLMAMIDPPREEVKAAISKCRASGIKTVMITGEDYKRIKCVTGFLQVMQELPLFASEHEVDELLEELWTRTGYMADLEAQRTIEAESRIENLKELLSVRLRFPGRIRRGRSRRLPGAGLAGR